MAELKSCPFCGYPVHITESKIRYYENRADCEAKIECGCGLTFEKEWIFEYKPNGQSVLLYNDDIVTAWNKRTQQKGDEQE